MCWTRRLYRLLLALAALLLAALVNAHPMPESRLWVDSTASGLTLTWQLPLNRLELVYGQPLADQPQQVLSQHGEALARYLLQHVGARSPDKATPSGSTPSDSSSAGRGWQAMRPTLSVLGDDRQAELQAVMQLRAPEGDDPRRLMLWSDVITHEVRTHRIQVLLRNDWAGGWVASPPQWLGELDHDHSQLPVMLGPTPNGAAMLRLLHEGALHILDGSDHLLFLWLLLVLAPLQVVPAGTQRRWGAARPAGATWRHVTQVVSAFTLGHTLTLVLGSSGWLAPPATAVEVGVALTIGLTAWHAARPWWPQAEALMAACFGLIHGLAFSASLSGVGLSRAQHALALLGFNLGIEGIQLVLVAALLPPLLMLATHRPGLYAGLRRVSAGLSLLASGAWVAERCDWVSWPWPALQRSELLVATAGLWLLATLTTRRRPSLR